MWKRWRCTADLFANLCGFATLRELFNRLRQLQSHKKLDLQGNKFAWQSQYTNSILGRKICNLLSLSFLFQRAFLNKVELRKICGTGCWPVPPSKSNLMRLVQMVIGKIFKIAPKTYVTSICNVIWSAHQSHAV
jgi:hypothetical protein